MSARTLALQCSRVGAAALPAAALGGGLLGVAWIVASSSPATALATLVQRVPRTFGPLVAGVLVAARVGAAMAGELAALRAGQQLDWMRAARLSPFRHLVSPRLIAAALVLPVATLVTDASALAAASALATRRGAPVAVFEQLALGDVWIGLAQAVLFGVTLAGVACAIGSWRRRDTFDVSGLAARGALGAMLAVAALELLLVASRLA